MYLIDGFCICMTLYEKFFPTFHSIQLDTLDILHAHCHCLADMLQGNVLIFLILNPIMQPFHCTIRWLMVFAV